MSANCNATDMEPRLDIPDVILRNITTWLSARYATIREIRELANAIDVHIKNCNIAKVAGSSTAVLGGLMASAGAILTLCTAGTTMPLMAIGGYLSTAGGLAVGGTEVTGMFLSRSVFNKAQATYDRDRQLYTDLNNSIEASRILHYFPLEMGALYSADSNAFEKLILLTRPAVAAVVANARAVTVVTKATVKVARVATKATTSVATLATRATCRVATEATKSTARVATEATKATARVATKATVGVVTKATSGVVRVATKATRQVTTVATKATVTTATKTTSTVGARIARVAPVLGMVMLPFDIYELVCSSNDLAENRESLAAKALRKMAEDLEAALPSKEQLRQLIG